VLKNYVILNQVAGRAAHEFAKGECSPLLTGKTVLLEREEEEIFSPGGTLEGDSRRATQAEQAQRDIS
jgi:hypothetical protein